MRWSLGLVAVLAAAVGVMGVIAAVTVLSGADATSIGDLQAGDCFDVPLDSGDERVEAVDVFDCAEPHEAEVVAVGELNPDRDLPYPADADLFAEIDRRCAALADEFADRFGLLPIAPEERSWEPLAGRFVCVAIPYGGGTTVGSLVGASAGGGSP